MSRARGGLPEGQPAAFAEQPNQGAGSGDVSQDDTLTYQCMRLLWFMNLSPHSSARHSLHVLWLEHSERSEFV